MESLRNIKVKQPEDYQYVLVHSLVVTDKLEGKRFDLAKNVRIPFWQYPGQEVKASFVGKYERHYKVFETPYFSPKFAKDQELTVYLDVSIVKKSASIRKQLETTYKALSFVKSGYMY